MSKIYQKPLSAGKNAGFTLIELLVVVLIIGILAAVALPQYQMAVSKSRYVQAMSAADALYKGIQVYYMANGEYPATLDVLDIDVPGTLASNKTTLTLPNGYKCVLYLNVNVMDSINCTYDSETSPNFLGYRIIFDEINPGRYCLAHKDVERSNQLCRAMGGKDPFDSGSGIMHYKLD